MEENPTATYFLRSTLFAYDIMTKFQLQYIFMLFFNQSLGLILGNIVFIIIIACVSLNTQLWCTYCPSVRLELAYTTSLLVDLEESSKIQNVISLLL